MKLSVILLTLTAIQVSASVYSQKTKFTLKLENVGIEKVLKEIQNNSEFEFLFNHEELSKWKNVNVDVKNATVDELLTQCLEKAGMTYEIIDKVIVLKPSTTKLAEIQQGEQVAGKITDVKGFPLPGVNIFQKGKTTTGTISNENGEFTVNVDNLNVTLVFSFVGFKSQEVPLNGRNTINVTLEEELLGMEEVVVTALGISKEKKKLSYAVQEVKGDELLKAKDNNIINNLSGNIAGVQVTSSSGGVGSSSKIILRGYTSLSSDNQPLFVVDGVPYDNRSDALGGRDATTDFGNAAADINPNDVESISVLKGPSAAALYGSRAANGVILITTKSAKAKMTGIGVEYSFNLGLESLFVIPDFQNEYGQGVNGEFRWVDGLGGGINDDYDQSWGPKLDGRLIDQFHGAQKPWVPAPDNYKDFFEQGVVVTNNIAFSTGGEKANARLSYTNLDHKGMMPNTDLTRDVISINSGLNLTDKLSATIVGTYTKTNSDNRANIGYGNANTGYVNPLTGFIWGGRQVDFANQLKDYENPDGTQRNWMSYFSDNPYWTLYKNTNSLNRDRVNGAITLNYKIADWLNIRGRVLNDFYREKRKSVRAQNTFAPVLSRGYFLERQRYINESNQDLMFILSKNVNDKLSIDGTLGTARMNRKYENNFIEVKELFVPNIYSTDNSATEPAIGNWHEEKEIQSVLGSLDLFYDNFLSLGFTARNDWSSTLPTNENSYFYFSTNLSVIFHEKLSLPEWFTFGKIRGSYAEVGNDTDPYRLSNIFTQNAAFNGVYPYHLGNLDRELPPLNLKPEITKSYEFGTELKFLNNKIGLDVTYYHQKSTNQILPIAISDASGYRSAIINAGQIDNKGVELQLYGAIYETNDFSWRMNINFAKNTSEVVELDKEGKLDNYQLGNYWNVFTRAQPGEPFGAIYGRKLIRDEETQKVIVDDNGLPMITSTNEKLGNALPDWTGGITNTISFKNLSLSFLIDIRHGGDVFSVTNYFGETTGVLASTLEGREGGWVVPNTLRDDGTGNLVENDIEIDAQYYYQGNWNRHEPYIYDGSYIKLRSASLGYEFPKKLISKLNIESLNLSVYGRNLWLIHSNVPNIDPEMAFSSGGVNNLGFEYIQSPSVRTLGLKLNVKF